MSASLPIRQRLAAIAKKEIGTREVGGNNKGPKVRQYQAATDLEGTGWPWCAAFICWIIREWIKDAEVREALGLKSAAAAEKWRPKTAAAFGFQTWGKKNGLVIFDDDLDHILHTADLMIFDMSHIGIVTNDRARLVYTVEGNTGPSGSREGDGVWDKTRDRSLARSFIRMID